MSEGFNIVSWNINSIRLRLELIGKVVDELNPDVLCLQEVRCPPEQFPHYELNALGFSHRVVRSAKGKGGVAILSRHEIASSFALELGGKTNDCRHIAATIKGIEYHNLYVPAGGYVPDVEKNEKFAHKLIFLEDLADWFNNNRRGSTNKHLLCGDLNIAPHENDVWSHEKMRNVVSHTEAEISRLNAVCETLRWSDVVRDKSKPTEKIYSWWTYRQFDWRTANKGRRLDHIWLCPELLPDYIDFDILTEARDWPRPSDHVPVRVQINMT